MIIETAFGSLDKSDRVISLLRHIPYFRESGHPSGSGPRLLPRPTSATGENTPRAAKRRTLRTNITSNSSQTFLSHRVSSHIIGLMEGGRDSPFILLDTEHGVIYWPDCNDEIRNDTTQEQVEDDPHA